MVDFCVQSVDLADKQISQDAIADFVIMKLESYEKEIVSKFIGAGIPYELMKKSPQLCSRLWLELDIVPITMMPHSQGLQMNSKDRTSFWNSKCVDEQADSMARKCIMYVSFPPGAEEANFYLAGLLIVSLPGILVLVLHHYCKLAIEASSKWIAASKLISSTLNISRSLAVLIHGMQL